MEADDVLSPWRQAEMAELVDVFEDVEFPYRSVRLRTLSELIRNPDA